MFNTLLVPTDGSDLSVRAIRAAVEFARDNGSRIVGLAVAETRPYRDFTLISRRQDFTAHAGVLRQQAEEDVAVISALAAQQGVPCQVHTVSDPSPWSAILSAVDTYACDSIFIASHSSGDLRNLLVGSQAQKILMHSRVPVIVFK